MSATAEAQAAARATAVAATGMTRLNVAPDAGTPPPATASAGASPVASPRRLPLAAPRQSRAAVAPRLRTTEKWAFTGTEGAQPPPLGFRGPPLHHIFPPHAPHHAVHSHPDCARRFRASAAAPYSRRHAQSRTTKPVPRATREHEGTPILRKRKIPPPTMRDTQGVGKEGKRPVKHRLERKCGGEEKPCPAGKKRNLRWLHKHIVRHATQCTEKTVPLGRDRCLHSGRLGEARSPALSASRPRLQKQQPCRRLGGGE